MKPAPRPAYSPVLLAASILLFGCLTQGRNAASLEAPGAATVHGARISANFSEDGTILLELRNQSSLGKRFSIATRPAVIGRVAIVVKEPAGYEDRTICEGELCRIVRVPIYREIPSEEPVFGDFESLPSRLSLEPEGSAVATVAWRNRARASSPFLLSVYVTIRDEAGAERLLIRCPSALLLGRAP